MPGQEFGTWIILSDTTGTIIVKVSNSGNVTIRKLVSVLFVRTFVHYFLSFSLSVEILFGFIPQNFLLFALMDIVAGPIGVHALENALHARSKLVYKALILLLLPLFKLFESLVGFEKHDELFGVDLVEFRTK